MLQETGTMEEHIIELEKRAHQTVNIKRAKDIKVVMIQWINRKPNDYSVN